MTASRYVAAAPAPRRRFGKILREHSLITKEQLDSALHSQQASGTGKLGELLLSQGLITREALIATLQEVLGVPYCDASQVTPEPAVLKLLPRSVALRLEVLPIGVEDRRLRIVAVDPRNLAFVDEVRFAAGMNVISSFGFREEIVPAIQRAYRQIDSAAAPLERVLEEIPAELEVDFGPILTRNVAQRETQEELRHTVTPAVRVVSAVIAGAVRRSASDVHFEHVPSGVEVRLRVDGLLCPFTFVDASLRNALISRLKILADLDIAERRVSQDGRFLARVGKRSFDVRVSTLPTQFGEKVVLRILDPQGPIARLEDLGLSAEQLRQIETVLELPQGMLLVSGPTGSGKSTTLYGALNRVRRPSINITTVEDPIEYMIQGANQVQVNVKAGRTFASLRSILRQDPNVLMVGEIRDDETAEIAMQAAQTGHLVLSTLHTNDAVSAIGRLRDLRAAPFLISASVTMVIGQRLVRKLCSCRRQAESTLDQRHQFAAAGIADLPHQVWLPGGCEQCRQTGYKGRAVIAELLHIDERLRPVIAAGESGERLRTLAEQHGMRFMRDDAIDKVRAGLTSLEEVLRVVPFERRHHAACGSCGAALLAGFLYCPFCATIAGGDVLPPETQPKPPFLPVPAEVGLS